MERGDSWIVWLYIVPIAQKSAISDGPNQHSLWPLTSGHLLTSEKPFHWLTIAQYGWCLVIKFAASILFLLFLQRSFFWPFFSSFSPYLNSIFQNYLSSIGHHEALHLFLLKRGCCGLYWHGISWLGKEVSLHLAHMYSTCYISSACLSTYWRIILFWSIIIYKYI